MNLNTTELPDFSTLSQDEIIQEYEKLHEYYQQLKRLQDEDKQKIYELTRNLDTANATGAYLSTELELLASNQTTAIEELQQKHNNEIEILKKKYSELLSDYTLLEKNSDDLQKTNEKLLKDLTNLEDDRPSSRNSSLFKNNYELEKEFYEIEKKNLDLLAENDDYHEKIKQMTLENAQQKVSS